MNKTYQVKLDTFEGPLDLLLHLIHRLEIDIYDIPVAEITDQYMNYIHTMQQIELNIASEYLVMAATLLEMKSSMLLPNKEVDGEEQESGEEELREQLLERLLEYRNFKEAAYYLKQKEFEENQLLIRPKASCLEENNNEVHMFEKKVTVFDLVAALQDITERISFSAPITTTASSVNVSVDDRMEELLEQLTFERVNFMNLFSVSDKQHIVVTFLAILQLMKTNDIICEQSDQFEPIFLSRMEA